MGFGRAAEEGKDLPDTPTLFLLYCEVSGCLDFFGVLLRCRVNRDIGW